MRANLVGHGVGSRLKAWSAERGRCGLFAAFKAPLAWLADGRLSPLAALGLSDTERPALACSFPKTQRVGKVLLSPLVCCKMAVRLAGLGAGGVKAPWRVCQPAGVGLFRRWASPNRAFSGHGFAVGQRRRF